MKNDDEIQGRIRELLDEAFQRRLRESEERLPVQCVHNYRHPLDSRKLVDGEDNPQYNRITQDSTHLPVLQTIGLCKYGTKDSETWAGTICEEPIDAIRCPPQAFARRTSAEQVRIEFEERIKDLAWVEEHLPRVHALLWALGMNEMPKAPEPPPPAEIVVYEEKPAQLSWWRQFVLRLLGLGQHRILPPPAEEEG